jgi:hypothetical protein
MMMPPATTRVLLRLYPRVWRERYGEELLALAGPRVTWRTAMDIIRGGIMQHLDGSGYSPAQFGRLFARLAIVFAAVMALMASIRVADFVMRFPDRPMTTVMARFLLLPNDLGAIVIMWLMFGLMAALLAILANGFGWRARWPRASAFLVRVGVAIGMFVAFAVTIPRHPSPSSYVQLGFVLVSSLLVGLVVESVRLGRSAYGASAP